MGSVSFYIIAFLLLVTVFLFVILQTVREKLKLANMRIEEQDFAISVLQKEKALNNEISKSQKENREKTDEKINELHNGNSVSNAINGLCKH